MVRPNCHAKAVILIFAVGAFRAAFGVDESINWRVWNSDDGMTESFVTQATRSPSGQVVIRNGDVSTFSVTAGERLTSLPDRVALGRIIPDGQGRFYSFDDTGILILENGIWTREPLSELARFQGFGKYKSLGWFAYPTAVDVEHRVGSALLGPGSLLLSFGEKLVQWSRGAGTRLLRESRDSAIGEFLDVVPDGPGTFFVSGTTGLASFTFATGRWTALAGAPGLSRFIFPSRTGDGEILVTASGGDGRKRLLRYSNHAWSVIYTGSANSQLRGWEADGRIWVMEDNKLSTFVKGQAKEVGLRSILSGGFTDVAMDGKSFLIASMQGLARYTPPLWRLPDGAPDLETTVNAMAQDKSGSIWFGSATFLTRYAALRWQRFNLPRGERLIPSQTGTLCPMNNGRLLVSVENASHVLELDPATGNFKIIPHPEGRRIQWIARRNDASIWVQSMWPGEATSRIETYDGKRFAAVPGAESIGTPDVRTMLLTRSGAIWIGGAHILARIIDGRLQKSGRKDGLPEDSGFSLAEAADGTVYIGQRNFINSFDGRQFHVLHGGGMDRVRTIAIAGDGTLWAASGAGIHRLRNGNWITNGREEGLPANPAYTVFSDRDGRVWAGTALGLSLYWPESDRDPPVTWMDEDRNLRKSPPGGEVRFAFSGMDRWKQTPQERLLFSWRLDNGHWSQFDQENHVGLRGLASGSHVFEARAMDRNGNIDNRPVAFRFDVLFPWYRAGGFYFVAIVLVFAIGLLVRSAFSYHRSLRFQSRHDSLTGLANRMHFEGALAAALEKPAAPVAVMFIDLDGFKGVNDSLGHLAGDKLLVDIGRRLRVRLGRDDLPARIGGDEFAVLLSNVRSREAVSDLASEVLEIVRACSPSPSSPVAASVGISLAPDHGTSPHVLVRLADLAMYQSKSRGGNVFLFYEPGMEDSHGPEVAGMLPVAMKEHRLALCYQPIVDRRRRVTRVEALIRIGGSETDIISPGASIEVAEESGIIHAVGNWVLREAARTVHLWRQRGCEIPVAVNFSPVQLERGELADEVLAVLAEFGLPPSSIVIEIRSSAIVRNQSGTAATLSRLRGAGLLISLGNFGTGDSAREMLNRLALDEIKLDRSLTASMHTARTRDFVSRTVTMARNLNLAVVAEGIEEPDQMEMEVAVRLGCDYFQGFLIAPPLEPDVALQFLFDQTGHNECSGVSVCTAQGTF